MVKEQTIKVWEEWRGTRGGQYYYVREGNLLRHISRYSIKRVKIHEGGRGSIIEYEVPLNRIKDKLIYSLGFSNSGYFYARKCKVDAFLYPKYPEAPGFPDFKRMKDAEEDLQLLEIETRDPLLKQTISELLTDYAIMIDEIKIYARRLNFEILFAGHASRTADMFNDLRRGLVACLSLPSDKARLKCLEVPMKWIHQLWIMKLACESLYIVEILKEEWQERPVWRIMQGSPYPAFVARSRGWLYSFWFEFQPSRIAHWVGGFIGERAPVRPDILVCKGWFKNARELKKVDLIIECKNKEFQYWQSDVETQLIPYFKKYRPANMILASMKPIPSGAKRGLQELGIDVVDGLAPGNEPAIREFRRLVIKYLG
ncbi:MAG: hypothetical protein QW579_01905 [Desulfurococcaceae archaeon]